MALTETLDSLLGENVNGGHELPTIPSEVILWYHIALMSDVIYAYIIWVACVYGVAQSRTQLK